MNPGSCVKAAVLSTINSTALTGDYQSINPSGLPAACFKIRIVNGGNTAVTVSYDGINPNEQVLPTSSFELSGQTNAQPAAWKALLPQLMQVYVTGTAGTSGVVSLSAYYV